MGSNRDCPHCGERESMLGVKVPNTAAVWPQPRTFTLWLPVAEVIIWICAVCDRAEPNPYVNDAFARLSRDHARQYNQETADGSTHRIDRSSH